jgi:acetyltransferase-like isoleucine patch superfamily enzyme
MTRVFIVGGNGFARECAEHLLELARADRGIQFAGFLGHNGFKVNFKTLSDYFVCDVAQYSFGPDDHALIGAGYPHLRKIIFADLKRLGAPLFTLMPAGVSLPRHIEIGEGNVFMPPFGPGPNVRIGCGNVFNGDVVVGHDCEIGDFNFFGPKTQLLGNCKIGDGNSIGAGSVLLPGCRIGNHNKVVPLSAVYKGCKSNFYLAGNPALPIGSTAMPS